MRSSKAGVPAKGKLADFDPPVEIWGRQSAALVRPDGRTDPFARMTSACGQGNSVVCGEIRLLLISL